MPRSLQQREPCRNGCVLESAGESLFTSPNYVVRIVFVSFKAFKFYLHPTAAQAENLDRIRRTCCEL